MQRVDKIVACEGGECGGCGVKKRDKDDGPHRGVASRPDVGNRVESDNDVGESRRADHEGDGDAENVGHGFALEGFGVFGEAEVDLNLV